MATLTFPFGPTPGQLYPSNPTPGQTQYEWDGVAQTWRVVGVATAVIPGVYGSDVLVPIITVDTQGRLTNVTQANIGATYVQTGNTGAFNGYRWPSADGSQNDLLTTNGNGDLVWLGLATLGVVTRVVTPPTTQSDPGLPGQVASDPNFFYWFDGAQWQRVASDSTPW